MNFQTIPSQEIRKMLANGEIIGANKANIQPASLDLTLSGEAYRMRWTFLPKSGEKIRDIVKTETLYSFDLSQPLEPGAIYLIKLKENLDLPDDVCAFTNNKSSTGRVNLQTRVVADGVPRFDRLPMGYKGPLWLEVSSKSFFIKLNEGDRVNQIRFFKREEGKKRISVADVYFAHRVFYNKKGEFIPFNEIAVEDSDNALIMSVDLDQEREIVGYKAAPSGTVLDFSKKDSCDPKDFFQSLNNIHGGRLSLHSGEFYILSTKEFIRVPPKYSVEMAAYDIASGEFRSHYAGFFDPGFGYGAKGEVLGTPAVLEVRPYDNNFSLRDGQPICKMVFMEVSEIPDLIYGTGELGSHYQKQRGAFLSKHFKKIPSSKSQ